ncbi:MAG: TIM barrel protein [Candidatus Woesearchaeota archaeon]
MEFKKLNFGTAGIPKCVKRRSSINGIKSIHELELDSMELEFVRGVRMKEEKALLVNEVAKENNVHLTVHAPYYINLNAKEKKKREKSLERIEKTARIGNFCGAYSITFHAAYYLDSTKEETYSKVYGLLKELQERLKKDNIKIDLRPELTGSKTQFGNLKEIIRLSNELEYVKPCIDFSHYAARYSGEKNNKEDFKIIFEELKENGYLNDLHAHISGIEWGDKGEKNHLNFDTTKVKWKAIIELLKEYDVKGVITCESPNLEVDAKIMKNYYNQL